MNRPQPPRQWSDATAGGKQYRLIAFYYNGRCTDWDCFYRFEVFGNFYVCLTALQLTIDGVTGKFHTAEAAFQATKWWKYDDIRAKFENAADGPATNREKKTAAKRHPADEDPAHAYAGPGRVGAMKAVLELKYGIPAFRDILLESADAYLLEHNEAIGRDPFWSDNHDGTGQNQLGRTLMELRESLGGSGIPDGANDVSEFTKQVRSIPRPRR